VSLGHRLFVYGSLMEGLKYAHLMASASFEGTSSTRELYTLLDLGPYPGAQLGGDGPLRGEVYRVDDATLRRLDELEGHPDFFRRHERTLCDGSVAWLYEIVRSQWDVAYLDAVPVVADGDWRRRLEERGPTE